MSPKKILKLLCPPILLKARHLFGSNTIRFIGNYASWKEAQLQATGYDTDLILQRVKESSRKVVSGEAAYERDSVCFYEKAYRWPLLAGLQYIATKQNNQLNLVDFGGALGSLYFQHQSLLSPLRPQWSVVEQAHFVECGKQEFQNEHLTFHLNLAECVQKTQSTSILISSVLQYLENPKQLLKEISDLGFKYILIDRTPFIQSSDDQLTVQLTPKSIYSASYPAWFFSFQRFENLMHALGYHCIFDFDCEENVGIGTFKGFLFEKN